MSQIFWYLCSIGTATIAIIFFLYLGYDGTTAIATFFFIFTLLRLHQNHPFVSSLISKPLKLHYMRATQKVTTIFQGSFNDCIAVIL